MIICNRDCDQVSLQKIAERLASFDINGFVVYLRGELGAGKTTFVRYYLSALGYTGLVKSPTYALVEPYHFFESEVYHFDLYRLMQPKELYDIGMDDYFTDCSQVFVEWPEKASGVLPVCDLEIFLYKADDLEFRRLKMIATSEKAIKILDGFL